MPGHIFISYARSDRSYVARLAEHLELHGIGVWYDYQLVAGEHFDTELTSKILTSAAVIVVLSPAAIASKWVSREIACADDANIKLVPLILQSCEKPLRLQDVHHENVTGGQLPPPSAIERLRSLVSGTSAKLEPEPDEQVSAEPGNGAFAGLITSMSGHSGSVRGLAFSSDGTLLASGSEDRTIRVWDTGTWKLKTTITTPSQAAWPLAFLPGTHTLAAATFQRGGVELIDAITGQTSGTLAGDHNDICDLAFSPDGTKLATGGNDRTARLWDVASGALMGRFIAGRAVPGWPLAFSPDGASLVIAHFGGPTAGLWDAASRQRIHGFARHTDFITAVAFAADGKSAVTAGMDTTVRQWDTTSGALVRTLRGHTRRVTALACSPTSPLIASASTDRRIQIWIASSDNPLRTLRGHTAYALAFSPDGNILASGGGDGQIRIWAAGSL